MTPQEKKIAIAEFAGVDPRSFWQVPLYADYRIVKLATREQAEAERLRHRAWCESIGEKDESKEPEEYDDWDHAPDYLTSRDAVCDAVSRLLPLAFDSYVENLERVCQTDSWSIMDSKDRRCILLASPGQMTDALLLTLGYKP